MFDKQNSRQIAIDLRKKWQLLQRKKRMNNYRKWLSDNFYYLAIPLSIIVGYLVAVGYGR